MKTRSVSIAEMLKRKVFIFLLHYYFLFFTTDTDTLAHSAHQESTLTPPSTNMEIETKQMIHQQNYSETNKSLEFVVECASHKLVWLSHQLELCTNFEECLKINELLHKTLDTLEKASRLLNYTK